MLPRWNRKYKEGCLTTGKEQQSVLREQTGVVPSLTEYDMKQYFGAVLKEIKILKDVEEILKKGKEILSIQMNF